MAMSSKGLGVVSQKCSNSLKAICEYDCEGERKRLLVHDRGKLVLVYHFASVSVSAQPSNCSGDGFVRLHSQGLYKMFTTELSSGYAEEACVSHGGHLAYGRTRQEFGAMALYKGEHNRRKPLGARQNTIDICALCKHPLWPSESKQILISVKDAYDSFWLGASVIKETSCDGDWKGCGQWFKWKDGSSFAGGSHWDGVVISTNNADEECGLIFNGELHDGPCGEPYNYLCQRECAGTQCGL